MYSYVPYTPHPLKETCPTNPSSTHNHLPNLTTLPPIKSQTTPPSQVNTACTISPSQLTHTSTFHRRAFAGQLLRFFGPLSPPRKWVSFLKPRRGICGMHPRCSRRRRRQWEWRPRKISAFSGHRTNFLAHRPFRQLARSPERHRAGSCFASRLHLCFVLDFVHKYGVWLFFLSARR